MTTIDTTPRRAILLARISDARLDAETGETDEHGVQRQLKRLRAHARRLGWKVGPTDSHVLVENDTSAFKRRKVRLPGGRHELRTVRPKFRQAIDMLDDGRADGLIAVDLDRTCRDPRDLEDLIDVVETRTPRLPATAITGSLDLSNDAGVTSARIMVAIANKSSRDTSRRVADARLDQAEQGRFGGGRRPFGFDDDGITIRADEAGEIVKWAEAILAGVSLRDLARDARERGVPTVTGNPWAPSTIRDILLRPRHAGLIVYQGQILAGATAPWGEIVPRADWETVAAILTDPGRRVSPGNTPRWLGSCIYQCGHPSHHDGDRPTMVVSRSGSRTRPAYKCREHPGHLIRNQEPVDDYVTKHVIARLERPDAADLIKPRPGFDTKKLHAEANAVRAQLTEAKDLWEARVFTLAELKTRSRRLTEKLEQIEARLSEVSPQTGPLDGLAGNPRIREMWPTLGIGRQRAVVQALVVVTLLPQGKGRPAGWKVGQPYFDEGTVSIEPVTV